MKWKIDDADAASGSQPEIPKIVGAERVKDLRSSVRRQPPP